jgi:hypothetical protein
LRDGRLFGIVTVKGVLRAEDGPVRAESRVSVIVKATDIRTDYRYLEYRYPLNHLRNRKVVI